MSSTDTTALPIAAGTWGLDPAHSAVEFTVRHLGLSKVRGRFADVEASLVVGETIDTTAVTAEVGLGSIDTNNEQRDGHLRSTDFFNLEANPTMTFVSTAISGTGDDWQLAGDLSINGVTRPVDFDVELNGTSGDPWGGFRVGFSAEATISRSDFGVDFEIPLGADGVVIGDKVKVSLELQFVAPSVD